jgi:hypothetical protein
VGTVFGQCHVPSASCRFRKGKKRRVATTITDHPTRHAFQVTVKMYDITCFFCPSLLCMLLLNLCAWSLINQYPMFITSLLWIFFLLVVTKRRNRNYPDFLWLFHVFSAIFVYSWKYCIHEMRVICTRVDKYQIQYV